MCKEADDVTAICQAYCQKSNRNITVMSCLAMAAMCRQRAQEDKERSEEWLAQAEMWNQLAGAAIGHPIIEGIANRPSDLAKAN